MFKALNLLSLLCLHIVLIPNKVTADALTTAEHALAQAVSQCYPDINSGDLQDFKIKYDGAIQSYEIGAEEQQIIYVVNPQHIRCAGSSAIMCGTRGCPIQIFAQNDNFSYIGWQPETLNIDGDTVLLLRHAGFKCIANYNAAPCYSILSWDGIGDEFLHYQSR